MTPIRIRPATLAKGDEELFANFWDSQLPWLATVGTDSQWGSISVREKYPRMMDKTRDQIRRSERGAAQPWDPTWCRIFIAEVEASTNPNSPLDTTENVEWLPVAAKVLEGS